MESLQTNLDLVLTISDSSVIPPEASPSSFPFWGSGESFYVDSCDRTAVSVLTRIVFHQARHMVRIPRFMLLGVDFQLPIGQVWSCTIGHAGFKQSLCTMVGGTDPEIGAWLDHPMLVQFFTSVARDPFTVATE